MTMPKSGTLAVPVVGIFEDREPINASYVIDTATYQRGFTDDRAEAVFVKLKPGISVASGRAAIAPVLGAFPNVKAFDQAEFKNQQRKQIQAILTLVTALLALAVLIALLGIANTLALSIFERTRELGLLRAVGMTRRQLRRMIRGESVIIAVIGAALGLLVGVVFGVAAVAALRSMKEKRRPLAPAAFFSSSC